MNDIFIWIGTPKPCLRLNRLGAGAFLGERQHPFFHTCPFLTNTFISTNVYCLCIFLKTPNRRGTAIEMAAEFCLEPHIDPIGDQNDVQYLSIVVNMLSIFWLLACLAMIAFTIFGAKPDSIKSH